MRQVVAGCLVGLVAVGLFVDCEPLVVFAARRIVVSFAVDVVGHLEELVAELESHLAADNVEVALDIGEEERGAELELGELEGHRGVVGSR